MATIQGLEQFEARVFALDLAVQRKVLTKSVKSGAELIRAAASRNVILQGLVLTGTLAEREVISVATSQSNAFYVLARIGPSRDAFYGRFPEFGTIYESEKPFLEPAFEETKDAALAECSRIFKEVVESF